MIVTYATTFRGKTQYNVKQAIALDDSAPAPVQVAVSGLGTAFLLILSTAAGMWISMSTYTSFFPGMAGAFAAVILNLIMFALFLPVTPAQDVCVMTKGGKIYVVDL